MLTMRYQKQKPLKTYFSLFKNHRLKLLLSTLVYTIKHAPVWIMPVLTANIINAVTEPSDRSMAIIWINGIIGLALVIQNIPTHLLFVRLVSVAYRNVEKNLRTALCIRLQQLSIAFHQNIPTGALQTKILRDVENVQILTKQLFHVGPGIIITLISALVITLLRVPHFVLIYLIIVPVTVVITYLLRKRVQTVNSQFRHDIEDMSGKIVEMIRMIPVTRAHNVEKNEIDKVNTKLEKVKHSGHRLDMLEAIFGSTHFVVVIAFNIITLVIAATLSYTGVLKIGAGEIVLLTTYFNALSSSVSQILTLIPQIMKGFESIKSMGEVLECPDIEYNFDKAPIDSVSGAIQFDDVSFRYDSENENAIDHFSLDVTPGEIIAFVGPSGSGKSTLMQLVLGFIRPNSGTISIDEKNMNDIDVRTFRRHISVVTQETILFNGSIKDNVVYGKENVSEEGVYKALESAQLKSYVDSLPQGIHTHIKEGGVRLSGGQRQRLAIARALIRDPKILLLDEATSALDVESEALIQNALSILMKGRTTFVVAHRLSTIREANRIIVMENGKMREIGNHFELLKKQGTYYQMVKLQENPTSMSKAG